MFPHVVTVSSHSQLLDTLEKYKMRFQIITATTQCCFIAFAFALRFKQNRDGGPQGKFQCASVNSVIWLTAFVLATG